MSSVKITELSNVLGSQINPSVDVLPIVRVGANSTDKITVEELGTLFGGGLEGSQYIYVAANGTDVENAAELQAAYDLAKTLSSSIDNRITIIAGPGKYEFNNSNPFTLDTEFIDLISLTGEIDVILYTTNANNNPTVRENIIINNNNIIVKGIDASKEVWQYASKGNFLEKGSFNISNNLNNLVCKNCRGGAQSFGGSGGTASGTFTNCIGEDNSFGGIGGTASGTYTNCISGGNSFGSSGTLSGKLFYCRLTSGTFATVSGSGRTYYCVDGNGDPNNQGFTPQNNL